MSNKNNNNNNNDNDDDINPFAVRKDIKSFSSGSTNFTNDGPATCSVPSHLLDTTWRNKNKSKNKSKNDTNVDE